MTKRNHTMRALLASVLSLLLCFSMLIGSTFAWFTDSATTGVNTIVAGNLDIVLEYYNGTDWEEVDEDTKLFKENALWEPGYVETAFLKVTNAGSLALKYQLDVKAANEVKGTNVFDNEFALSDYIYLGVVESLTEINSYSDRAAAIKAVEDTAATIKTKNFIGSMAEGDEKYYALVVYMPDTVDNNANHKTNTTAPSIELGVNLVATQNTVEEDSFGSDYDAGAKYPTDVPTTKPEDPTMTPGTAQELHDVLTTALTGGAANGTITINLEKNFDLANGWTTVDGSNYSGVNNVVINGNGNYISNLNQPLLDTVFAGADGSMEFVDLTIKDSVINVVGEDDRGMGVFLSTADATNIVKFTECTLDNVKMTVTNAETYLGGFLGYSSSNSVEFTDCSVIDCEFNGKKDIGAFVGYTTAAMTVTNPTITDTEITSESSSTYRVGLIAGTVNVNPATITLGTGTISNNTVTQANANTAKTSDYAGRVMATITVN